MTEATLKIYKIMTSEEWAGFTANGIFTGAAVDVVDGYIHLSTAGQVRATAAKHFGGRTGLILLEVDAASLGPALRWEPSRGGELFPHLYDLLNIEAIRRHWPLPWHDHTHQFPAELDDV